MLWAAMTTTTPPAMAAAPMTVSPDSGMLNPATIATTPAATASSPLAVQRPTTLLGLSTIQPRLTTCDSSFESKVETADPNLGSSSASM